MCEGKHGRATTYIYRGFFTCRPTSYNKNRNCYTRTWSHLQGQPRILWIKTEKNTIKIRESSRSVYKKNQKTSSSCSYRVIETIIKACENSEKLRKQSTSISLLRHFSFSFVKSLLDWTVIWNLLVRFYYNQFPVTDHWSVFQGKYTKRAFSSL